VCRQQGLRFPAGSAKLLDIRTRIRSFAFSAGGFVSVCELVNPLDDRQWQLGEVVIGAC
jgi:hypothetical protein